MTTATAEVPADTLGEAAATGDDPAATEEPVGNLDGDDTADADPDGV